MLNAPYVGNAETYNAVCAALPVPVQATQTLTDSDVLSSLSGSHVPLPDVVPGKPEAAFAPPGSSRATARQNRGSAPPS
jgi:hypothetical protein